MTTIWTQGTRFSLFMFGTMLCMAGLAHADDYVLTLKDHQFSPPDLELPADKRVKLIVKNTGPGEAEFESSDLNREKIVSPGGEITVFIGPLNPGNYSYFDDFHRETTGTIIVK
jgi:hypothetical protein